MKSNPPVNIFLGGLVEKLERGELRVAELHRDKLAERLGIAPKERLAMTVVSVDRCIAASALVDGGDLTPAQEKIFREFLEECDAIEKVIGVIPERPVTS